MSSHIIAGLDIGSHSIKMAQARLKEEEQGQGLEIIGLAQEPSSGVRKGQVVKPKETAEKILALKQRVANLSSHKVDQVLVNIGGSHISVVPSHGIVAVSRADGQISQEDVDRVMGAAQTFSLPSNKEVLSVFPKRFMVDGQDSAREVAGMKGVRLEADVLALCAFSPYIKNLTEAVFGADLDIAEIVPSPLMGTEAVLTPRQKELGVAVIDLGAGTTNLAVYEEGDVVHAAVFPVGSENITNDIAIGLRTEHDIAEAIKKEFGTLSQLKGKRKETLEIPDSPSFTFSPKIVMHIIEARAKEIFQFVNKEFKTISRQGTLPGGVVLIGGGAKLPKIAEFAKKELKLPSRIGTPHGIATFETDPVFLGVMGLVARGFQSQGHGFSAGSGDFMQRVKKIFKIFIP
ncbi:MAG: cell division protein FtsA [Candidatus Wildermuthbacteria bacterium]|nr:cell division protein FtsA [Candidatus Wildermuthbacteria bacterium]